MAFHLGVMSTVLPVRKPHISAHEAAAGFEMPSMKATKSVRSVSNLANIRESGFHKGVAFSHIQGREPWAPSSSS